MLDDVVKAEGGDQLADVEEGEEERMLDDVVDAEGDQAAGVEEDETGQMLGLWLYATKLKKGRLGSYTSSSPDSAQNNTNLERKVPGPTK